MNKKNNTKVDKTHAHVLSQFNKSVSESINYVCYLAFYLKLFWIFLLSGKFWFFTYVVIPKGSNWRWNFAFFLHWFVYFSIVIVLILYFNKKAWYFQLLQCNFNGSCHFITSIAYIFYCYIHTSQGFVIIILKNNRSVIVC